jgi:predicted transcriptional regulator
MASTAAAAKIGAAIRPARRRRCRIRALRPAAGMLICDDGMSASAIRR